MSLTGQLQAIGSRGYSLRWSTTPADRQDYETLVLDILDRAGAVVASDRRPVRVGGSVVTKDGGEMQRLAQVAWAEGITRTSPTPPTAEAPPLEIITEPVPVQEEAPHGEIPGYSIPDIHDVETQANDPV